MDIYHQLGHNEKWNIDSFDENIGDGLIFSPLNLISDKLEKLSDNYKKSSFFDPQLYLLNHENLKRKKLETYSYFPGNLRDGFNTNDLNDLDSALAQHCINVQERNNFKYYVIPTRHHENYAYHNLIKDNEHFVSPFLEATNKLGTKKKILLTSIIKSSILNTEQYFDEYLTWITSHQNIQGVYLIFENNFSTKQIKDYDYLKQSLRIINVLKDNGLEVHLGYTNTEAIVYSLAMPDSCSMGAFENLRSFNINRFLKSEGTVRSPSPRIYSSYLFQWIEFSYIQAMKDFSLPIFNYFDNTSHLHKILESEKPPNFQTPEVYKHFFEAFYTQVKNLPNTYKERVSHIKSKINNAFSLYSEIEDKVKLDHNSDGSHLSNWLNAINWYDEKLGE